MAQGIGPQTLGPDAERSLIALGRLMAVAQDDWCLIGGTAAALYGMKAPLADIDVLMSVADTERVFAQNGLRPMRDSGTARFRSEVFCRWNGLAVPVEFMAGFDVKSQGRWVRVTPRPAQEIPVGDARVWLPSIDDLIVMYELFDRPQDRPRVAYLSTLRA